MNFPVDLYTVKVLKWNIFIINMLEKCFQFRLTPLSKKYILTFKLINCDENKRLTLNSLDFYPRKFNVGLFLFSTNMGVRKNDVLTVRYYVKL